MKKKMILGAIQLYHLQVFQNDNVIFDDVCENLPQELKNFEYKSASFENGKMLLEI